MTASTAVSPLLDSSLEIMYGDATVTAPQVNVPVELQDSVLVIPQDPASSGTDVLPVPVCEPVPKIAITKPAPIKIQNSPRFSYDSAIAKLKAAGTKTQPGVPIIHGDVHESTRFVQRNYSAGIKYLLTGNDGAKKLVMSKKCKYEPNVTRFVGESIGFIKGFNEKSQPSKKFQNINLVSLGAAFRKADQTENINKVHCPRTSLSSTKFDSEITVENADNKDSQEITTIDWDFLKSVTMDMSSNSIDIRIPDSAVMHTYKFKKKKVKRGAETLDKSELQSCAKQNQTKCVHHNSGSDIPQRKPRKPKNSYKSQHLKIQNTRNTPVNTSTLDSIRGLLGAKIMQEKESLTALESAFPVVNHHTPQTQQNNIYKLVSLLDN